MTATHRVHWKASADAHIVGHRFHFCRTLEDKVKQAGYLTEPGLIPERCSFGPRRVILEGEVDYSPPRWHPSRPALFGYRLAEDTIRWTLRMLYGMDPPGGALDNQPEPTNLRVEIRVRPLAEVAA